MKPLKVAAVQMNALKDDFEHNLGVHTTFIRRAARQGCDLVLFPELSVTAHYGDQQVIQFAEPAGTGRIHETMSELAALNGVLVSYGFCEMANGTHYNSQALVSPDGLIGVQRKVHASADEYFCFRMGRSLDVFDTRLGCIATLICYDSTFCEAWRVLALQGAEILLLPHAARTGWGKRITRRKQTQSIRARLKNAPGSNGVYARSNGVFAVYCNQAGYNGHSTHGGSAYVLDPFGNVLARSRASIDDQMITAVFNPSLLCKARQQTGFTLKTRRPEVYGKLVEMV